jgi:hypothetical protein
MLRGLRPRGTSGVTTDVGRDRVLAAGGGHSSGLTPHQPGVTAWRRTPNIADTPARAAALARPLCWRAGCERPG